MFEAIRYKGYSVSLQIEECLTNIKRFVFIKNETNKPMDTKG